MKSYLYILLAIMMMPVWGCKKYLEHPPDDRMNLNSVEKIQELLVSAYPKTTYITFCEAMSDNVGDKNLTSVDRVNQNPYFFEDTNSSDPDTPNAYWDACYAAIAVANQVLENISRVANPVEYRAQKGEALVARAYAHFMLVTLFAKIYNPATAAADLGIPYVTEPEKVVFKNYSRKTVAYVYQQIEKDLTEGLPLIKNSVYKVPKYHFTTTAAHAFAARFYLFKKDYHQVVAHANAVLTGGSVLSYLRPINSVGYRSVQYMTRQAQYTSATTNANLLLAEAESKWGSSYPYYRYGYTFDLMSSMFGTSNVTGGAWAFIVYGQEMTLNIPKFRENVVRKNLGVTYGNEYDMIPLFGIEEVLFNRAEANTYLGNVGEALRDLNDYASTRITSYTTSYLLTVSSVTKFYNTSLEEGLIKTILDFKRVEFLFEGHRWFDILRHRIAVIHRGTNGQVVLVGPNDPRRVLQLPQEVALSGLERNPR